ncbi:hypothetical protein C4572_03975 [Candidatus Parcubacteria bacterium]|nr:MAG: hypothetical protein C4572_03975 [Candidatus Parcubacteria bacterium]
MKKLALILIVLILIAAGFFALNNKGDDTEGSIDQQTSDVAESQTEEELLEEVDIELPEDDFNDLEAELNNL